MRTAASRKMMTRTPSPPMAHASSSSNPEAEKDTNKPPIVLRIFKGTSQLVSTTTTPTSPSNEFEVQLVEEHDLYKKETKSRPNNLPKMKRGREKKERVSDPVEDEDETVLPVNTATSRAQRYSRRQAAMETETDSEPIPFIPTPKKAARYGYGRGIEKAATNAVDTSSSYSLYMSPEASAPTDNPYR